MPTYYDYADHLARARGRVWQARVSERIFEMTHRRHAGGDRIDIALLIHPEFNQECHRKKRAHNALPAPDLARTKRFRAGKRLVRKQNRKAGRNL